MQTSNAKLPSVLSEEDFKRELENAKKAARAYLVKNHRMYTMEEKGNTVIIHAFGGKWNFVIDRDKRQAYCISHKKEVAADVFETSEFNLFFTQPSVRNFRQDMWKITRAQISKYFVEHAGPIYNMPDGNTLNVVSTVEVHRHWDNTPMAYSPKLSLSEEMVHQLKWMGKATIAVLNTTWGGNWQKVLRTLGKFVWSFLDREIARFAIMMNQNRSTTFDYNLVWNNLDEVRKVASHSPGLLAVWPWVAGRNFPKHQDYKMPNIVSDIQDHFKEFEITHRLTSKGWRYLLKSKPLWISSVIRGTFSMHPLPPTSVALDISKNISSLPRLLNFLAEVNESPRYVPFFQICHRSLDGAPHSDSTVALVRAAFKASAKCRRSRLFYPEQFQLVWDWYINSYTIQDPQNQNNLGYLINSRCQYLEFDANQKKAPWSWFMRQQEQWHIDQRNNAGKPTVNLTWESLLKEFKHHKYTVTPLIDSMDLWDEGKRMHHCVVSYASSCHSGHSRIFSVREGEKHLATIEITRYAGFTLEEWRNFSEEEMRNMKSEAMAWRVSQTRGVCNQFHDKKLETKMKTIAGMIARRYSKLSSERETTAPAQLPKPVIDEDDGLDWVPEIQELQNVAVGE